MTTTTYTVRDLSYYEPKEQGTDEDQMDGARDRATELWGAEEVAQMSDEEMFEAIREYDYWTFVR